MENRLVLVLCLASLLFVSASMYKVSSEENNVLKVSDELRATLSNLGSNDTLLVWLDVYILPLPDGNVYLSSSDFSPVTDLGAKIAGVTFSPNRQLLWYLIEARAEHVSSLANLPMVRNVSLAMIGVWDWWAKPWRNVISVDPLLNMTAQRVAMDFANASVQVVINYEDVVLNQTEKSKQEISGEISALVTSVGAKVTRIGLAEYVLAEIPPNELSRLFENEYVRTLEALQPIYLRGGSFGKSTSYHGQSPLFMLLVPLCVACYSMQKRRKIKLTLILSLLLTSFLLSYNMPSTYALNVSRPAIRADQTGYDGNGIVVAVIDSGIDFNHGDLVPAILADVDMTSGNDPMDYSGHGTHVAGIVASQSGTYTGIAPGSQIISLKVNDTASILDAIQWCIDNRTIFDIRAIQLSWGEATEQPGDGTDPLSMKADDAVMADIAVVVAVMDHDTNGNGIYELSNPEQAFNVIAVGAVNDQNTVDINDDTVAYYSAGNSTTDGRPKPDAVAPGGRTARAGDPLVGIWSTRSAQAPTDNYEAVSGVYGRMSGTSMAAPHVSGAVALMLEANPDLTPAQVKAILRQTANLTTNLRWDARAGHGIIDACAAVQLAQNVSNIDKNLMYDRFWVETPHPDYGDYLSFVVEEAFYGHGVSVTVVDYNFGYYKKMSLLRQISAQHVWKDGVYYDLHKDMHLYLNNGPRIIERGSGYVKIQAIYRIPGPAFIFYEWKLGVDEIQPFLRFIGFSSWKTLIYIDTEVWDSTDYVFLPGTRQTVKYERKVTGDALVNVRDLDHDQYVQLDPSDTDNPEVWILNWGYYGNNPDEGLNSEYLFDRNVVIHYQATSSLYTMATPHIYRNTNGRPPNPQKPNGTETGYTNTEYEYSTKTDDPEDDDVHYEFDWNITTNTWTEWKPSDTYASAFRAWGYPGTYHVKARAQDSQGGFSGWSSPALEVTIQGQPGGCPYIYVWNGSHYAIDNNLLGDSEASNGTDVEDWYTLEQTLIPTYEGRYFSSYSLLIGEYENEHSYFDQVQLLAVDHESDVNVAVTVDGEILTYRQPYAPVSCVDSEGNSQLEIINAIDDNYYTGYPGDYLVLDFGDLDVSNGAKLVLRSDLPGKKKGPECLHVQVLDATGSWVDVLALRTRAKWTTEIVDLSGCLPDQNGELKVRLYFSEIHKLDYAGLDTSMEADIEIHDAYLVLAVHSEEGFVTLNLLSSDDIYAELIPGQQLELYFVATAPQDEARTFIFYAEGHYYTITS